MVGTILLIDCSQNPAVRITACRKILQFFRLGLTRLQFAVFFWGLALFNIHCAAQQLQVDYRCDDVQIFRQGQVVKDGWLNSTSNSIPIKKGNHPCWARISVAQASGLALSLTGKHENILLYDAQQKLTSSADRLGTSFNAVVTISQILFYPIDDAPGYLYARIGHDDYYGYDRVVTVALVDFKTSIEHDHMLGNFQIATLSVLIVIAFIAILFAFAVRNKNYALFALYSLCVAAISAFELMLPQQLSHSSLLSWFWFCSMYPLANAFSLIVMIEIGQFKYHSPSLKVILKWMAGAYVLIIPLWFVAATSGDHVNSILNLVGYPLLYLGFWRGMRKNNLVCLLLFIGNIPNVIVGIPGFLTELTGYDWTPGFIADSSWLEFASNALLPLMFLGILALRSLAFRRKSIYLEMHDPLTGLPNREYLQQLDMRQISKARNLVVLVINVKRFRIINEALGARTGDHLLAEVGRRLKKVTASHIARLHADQFCILTTDLTLTVTIEELRQVFNYPALVNGQTVDLAIAVGAACEHDLDTGPDNATQVTIIQLIRNAEIALDVARTQRLNWVEYDKVLESARQQDLGLMSELNRAVANNEFRLFLQPKIRMSDCALCSAEALIRWQHPKRGLINPEYFIPFAEATGCIRMITHWMLGEAMNISARMRASGNPIQIAVNLSALDLGDDTLQSLLKELLQKLHARAGDIRLEITEHSAMSNPAVSLEVMHALRDLGFSLSIDDFGTGYSSLSYLQKIPLSELKIDRSFVSKVISSDAPNILLKAIINLGHQLGLSVVAEGVETKEEWDVLAALECDFVQGFYVAKAMEVEQFVAWHADGENFKPGKKEVVPTSG
jgi:diguanylate cyclase (GGDEF)-like protein